MKSNEADIKGQCGVCITLLGLREKMSDRNPHGGGEEAEREGRGGGGTHWGTTGFNWDTSGAACLKRIWSRV